MSSIPTVTMATFMSGSPGSLKRHATSPPDASTSSLSVSNPLKAAKLQFVSTMTPPTPKPKPSDTASSLAANSGSDDVFTSPSASPTKMSIHDQVLKALSGDDFREKIACVVTETVVATMSGLEPKIVEFDDKIANLTATTEILQAEINVLKSKPKFTGANADSITASLNALKEDVERFKKMSSAKDELILNLTKRVEHLESYSRRNAIRISNIDDSETRGNDPTWMVEFARKHLGVTLYEGEIGRMHRTGPRVTGKPRDILVKFISYNVRARVYSKRAFLKDATNPNKKEGVFLNEHLTKQRSTLFYKAREGTKARKITSTWTYDGAVITRQLPGKDTPTKSWSHMKDLAEYLGGLEILPIPVPVPTEDTTV